MSPSKRQVLHPGEVAAEFGVDLSTLRRWVRRGRIKAEVTGGGHHRFRPEAVQAFRDAIAAGKEPVEPTFNRYRHRFADGVWSLYCLRCRELIVPGGDDLYQDELTLGDVCRAALAHERDSHG